MSLRKKINDIPVKYFYILAILLIFPALLINLGLLTFNEDEAIRSLVALEMKYSGNLIVPTLNGTYYYFKPPLYNWIILLFYHIFDDVTPWTARFTTIVNLLTFTYTIYLINRKYLDKHKAIIIALVFITCGRIIFWDSMLAYIDISYSWVTYVEIMSIFIFYKKKKYWQLFLVSYLLMSIGFLMKGYTSIAFQGLSLVAFFIWKKDFKRLFSIPNFVGLGLFGLIVGGYYFAYSQYNSIESTFTPLLDQSVRRTALHKTIDVWQTVRHLFTYPFDNIYHFLPWSLMIILIFSKRSVKVIFKNDFVAFNAIMFLANITVYWVSVEVYPRYILMLAPMIFTVYIYMYDVHFAENSRFVEILHILFLILFVAIFAVSLLPYFEERAWLNDNYIQKTIFLNISILLLAITYYLRKNNKLIILVLLVLVVRIGYDWFMIPGRRRDDPGYDKVAINIGNKYKNEAIYIYKKSKIDYTASYYIARQRGKITRRKFKDFLPQEYYLIDTSHCLLDTNQFKIIEEFIERESDRTLFVIKPKKIIKD